MSKIQINCKDTKTVDKDAPSPPVPKEKDEPPSNKRDAETQTEEIFFKMHWSHFVGDYPILQGKYQNRRLGSSRDQFWGFSNRQKSIGPPNNVFNNYYNNIRAFNNKRGYPSVSKPGSLGKGGNNNFYNNNRMIVQPNHYIKKGFGYI